MAYHSDQIPIYIGFKSRVYFSVSSSVLNDVNVRGDGITKPTTRNRYWSQVDSILASKVELNLKTRDMPFMLVDCLF